MPIPPCLDKALAPMQTQTTRGRQEKERLEGEAGKDASHAMSEGKH